MADKIKPDDPRQTGKQPRSRTAQVAVSREIEQNLKRVYQASLTEPVPDRFAQLLAELRKTEVKP
jgi:hypothetical protein